MCHLGWPQCTINQLNKPRYVDISRYAIYRYGFTLYRYRLKTIRYTIYQYIVAYTVAKVPLQNSRKPISSTVDNQMLSFLLTCTQLLLFSQLCPIASLYLTCSNLGRLTYWSAYSHKISNQSVHLVISRGVWLSRHFRLSRWLVYFSR